MIVMPIAVAVVGMHRLAFQPLAGQFGFGIIDNNPRQFSDRWPGRRRIAFGCQHLTILLETHLQFLVRHVLHSKVIVDGNHSRGLPRSVRES